MDRHAVGDASARDACGALRARRHPDHTDDRREKSRGMESMMPWHAMPRDLETHGRTLLRAAARDLHRWKRRPMDDGHRHHSDRMPACDAKDTRRHPGRPRRRRLRAASRCPARPARYDRHRREMRETTPGVVRE